MKASVVLLAALALLIGCGVKPTDYPLAAGQSNPTQAPLDADPDHPLVVMTFSGGGSRAAALAAAVVERLNNLHYTTGGVYARAVRRYRCRLIGVGRQRLCRRSRPEWTGPRL